MNKFFVVALLAAIFSLSACEKNESDDINKAQNCLDKVHEANPDEALACLEFVKGYDSQQANILKCSIYITSGGLMETKITKGYNILKDSTQTNKAASFMAVLALDYPDLDTGYTKAVQASEFCTASGVPGLRYLSDIVVAGSFMAKTLSHFAVGAVTLTPTSSPTVVNNALNSLISKCAPSGGAPDAACATDLPQLAATVTSLAGSYCSTSGADPNVCNQIDAALATSGGNSAAAGQAMLCCMGHLNYDPTLNQCGAAATTGPCKP